MHAGEELDSVLRMSLRLAPVVIALVGEGAVAAPAVEMRLFVRLTQPCTSFERLLRQTHTLIQ